MSAVAPSPSSNLDWVSRRPACGQVAAWRRLPGATHGARGHEA